MFPANTRDTAYYGKEVWHNHCHQWCLLPGRSPELRHSMPSLTLLVVLLVLLSNSVRTSFVTLNTCVSLEGFGAAIFGSRASRRTGQIMNNKLLADAFSQNHISDHPNLLFTKRCILNCICPWRRPRVWPDQAPTKVGTLGGQTRF